MWRRSRSRKGSAATRHTLRKTLPFLLCLLAPIALLCAGNFGANDGKMIAASNPDMVHGSSFVGLLDGARRMEAHLVKPQALSGDEEEGKEEESDKSGLEFDEQLSLKDLRTIVFIVLVLILLTLMFEAIKEHLEESISEDMEIILEKLFGELTVLGFLSMVTFMVSKAGIMGALSEKIFENEEELLEYFEYVAYSQFGNPTSAQLTFCFDTSFNLAGLCTLLSFSSWCSLLFKSLR